MTIMDKLLEFDPALTALTTGTLVSTNIIDTAITSPALPANASKPGRDLGIGSDAGPTPRLQVIVDATFVSGTSINFQFQAAPDNGSGLPGAYQTLAESGAVLTANLTLSNRPLDIDVPKAPTNFGINPPRFYRMQYVIVGVYTLGSISARIVLTRDDWVGAAAGFVGGYQAGFAVNN